MIISHMTPADLALVDLIQRRAYAAELIESLDALRSRLRVAPEFAFVARAQPNLMGYLFAHPWPADQSPGLSHIIETLPDHCDALHLHDMAVDPHHGGRGVGRALLTTLIDATGEAGFSQVTLVAVQDADRFWQKMGFRAVRRVDGYDGEAILMRFDVGK